MQVVRGGQSRTPMTWLEPIVQHPNHPREPRYRTEPVWKKWLQKTAYARMARQRGATQGSFVDPVSASGLPTEQPDDPSERKPLGCVGAARTLGPSADGPDNDRQLTAAAAWIAAARSPLQKTGAAARPASLNGCERQPLVTPRRFLTASLLCASAFGKHRQERLA